MASCREFYRNRKCFKLLKSATVYSAWVRNIWCLYYIILHYIIISMDRNLNLVILHYAWFIEHASLNDKNCNKDDLKRNSMHRLLHVPSHSAMSPKSLVFDVIQLTQHADSLQTKIRYLIDSNSRVRNILTHIKLAWLELKTIDSTSPCIIDPPAEHVRGIILISQMKLHSSKITLEIKL